MGVIVAMAVTGHMYYQYSVIPMKNKIEEQAKVMMAQDLRDQEQQAAIAAIQANMEKTTQANKAMSLKNQQYETEMADYLDIFRRHNMAKLASAKPGLIQKRANAKTEEVFNEIEDISNRIHSFND